MPVAFPLLLLAGPIGLSLARDTQVERNGKFVAKIAKFLLAFFCLECATRYLFSPFIGFEGVDADGLYRYKESIFFADSNSTGLALLCLTAALLVFRQHVGKHHIFLAYALMAATVSRASIIAAICQLFIYNFWRWRRLILVAILIGAPIVTFFLFQTYITQGPDSFNAVDGSFASKFLILERMAAVWSQADTLQKLVGIGSGNTQGLIGIAAHSIIAGFILELGFVGSALVITYVWLLSRRSSQTFYLLTVPIMINGFSLVLTSMPYFYVTLGLLSAIPDREQCVAVAKDS